MSKIQAAVIEREFASHPVCALPAAANANGGPIAKRHAIMREEIDEMEQVVTAAVLVATSFRLRDEDGLIASLRGLAKAVDHLDALRAGSN